MRYAKPQKATVQEWLHKLQTEARRRGLKWTRQRRLIAEVFFTYFEHLTAEQLYEKVRMRMPRIGITTVYRTLNLMVRLGYARELNFEDGRIRYEPRGVKPHHDHLVCIRCGRYIEFYDETLERLQESTARAHRFRLMHHRLDIFGYCADCFQATTGSVQPSDRQTAAS